MLTGNFYRRSILVAAALVIGTGCAARVGVGYRSYDPYHTDYPGPSKGGGGGGS